jgi:hypothetical protein
LVCAGVLKLETMPVRPKGKFKTPYINSKFVMPLLLIAAIFLNFTYNKDNTLNFLSGKAKLNDATTYITTLNKEEVSSLKQFILSTDSTGFLKAGNDAEAYLSRLDESLYASFLTSVPVGADKKFETGWNLFKHKIPTWIFILVTFLLTYWAFTKNLSLIPLLGLISCLYMMSEMGVTNWMGFSIWLVAGLVIYFLFSYKNSKLNRVNFN